MQRTIKIERVDGSFSQVVVGDVVGMLEELTQGRKVVVITDSNVHRRYRGIIDRYDNIITGLGETHKTLITVGNIYDRLIELGADRESFIVGFGGGIVTDITGFVASTYMRGVRFGFVATTLLAQVDASVGGKNGVNVQGYKNMVGTFNQPDFVLCDTSVLKTLPEREFRAGMAEVIKSAVIADPELFALLEENTYETLQADPAVLARVITAAVGVKADIVGRDEREAGERRKLNLGHTFAHAIEKSSDRYIHGEAVSIGTVMISAIATDMGLLSEGDAERIKSLFERYGLPVESDIDSGKLLGAIRLDKKKDADSIYLVLPVAIGDCVVRKMAFDDPVLTDVL